MKQKTIISLLIALMIVPLTSCGRVEEPTAYAPFREILTQIDAEADAMLDDLQTTYSTAVSGSAIDRENWYASVVPELNAYYEKQDAYCATYYHTMEDQLRDDDLDWALREIKTSVSDRTMDRIYKEVYRGLLQDAYVDFYAGTLGNPDDITVRNNWSDEQWSSLKQWRQATENCYTAWKAGSERFHSVWSEISKGSSYDVAMKKVVETESMKQNVEKQAAEAVNLEILYDGSIFGANVVGYQGNGNRAVITCNDEYFCYAVTSIGKSAFENCSSLQFVQFTEGDIVEIGERAFKNCEALEAITIPFKTETIGAQAFENCGCLSSLRILGCTEIGEYAFAGCTSLTEVTIPPDTEIIRAHAFDGCTALEAITLSGDNTVIEDGAFDNCPKLKDVMKTD